MPHRLTGFAVVLFSLAVILLALQPNNSGFGVTFDPRYVVPIIALPTPAYQLTACIAVLLSLSLVIGAFPKKSRETLDKFLESRAAYFPVSLVYWFVYTVAYLKGYAAIISAAQPAWVVYLAVCYGFFLFLAIPVLGLRQLFKLARQ